MPKEMQETLYHFHEPQTEEGTNARLFQFLRRYNALSGQHSVDSGRNIVVVLIYYYYYRRNGILWNPFGFP